MQADVVFHLLREPAKASATHSVSLSHRTLSFLAPKGVSEASDGCVKEREFQAGDKRHELPSGECVPQVSAAANRSGAPSSLFNAPRSGSSCGWEC